MLLHVGQPSIVWKKSGHQGLHIYVDRGDGKGYGAMPYTDTKLTLHEYLLPGAGLGKPPFGNIKITKFKEDIEIRFESN